MDIDDRDRQQHAENHAKECAHRTAPSDFYEITNAESSLWFRSGERMGRVAARQSGPSRVAGTAAGPWEFCRRLMYRLTLKGADRGHISFVAEQRLRARCRERHGHGVRGHVAR